MTRLEAEHVVVGSGAGGALTAARLAQAGHDVLVLEEGPWIEQGTFPPFSLEQIARQYRGGGLTAALGRPPVAYAEGRCAGGGTEVNSGLYHRPPDAVLHDWARRFGVEDLTPEALAPHAEAVEAALAVSPLAGPAPPASQALADGARVLGWDAAEVPRWLRQDATGTHRQSMTATFLPQAIAAGARVQTGVRVQRLTRSGAVASGVRAITPAGAASIAARHVWLCAGAIGTPAILQRSGLRRGIGATLRLHPTAKLAARFPAPLEAAADVPVHQVKEFAPNLSLGGSASRPEHVALALADSWERNRAAAQDWERIAVYYAAIRSQGHGRVRAVPGVADPIVTYRLTRADLDRLASGLGRLAHLLLAAGATEVYPSLRGAPAVSDAAGVARIPGYVTRGGASLMTVHLFSTVPIGSERAGCPADSFGRLRGLRNVRVNDAAMLPGAPGVNPQGTVMALASRNVAAHLEGA